MVPPGPFADPSGRAAPLFGLFPRPLSQTCARHSSGYATRSSSRGIPHLSRREKSNLLGVPNNTTAESVYISPQWLRADAHESPKPLKAHAIDRCGELPGRSTVLPRVAHALLHMRGRAFPRPSAFHGRAASRLKCRRRPCDSLKRGQVGPSHRWRGDSARLSSQFPP